MSLSLDALSKKPGLNQLATCRIRSRKKARCRFLGLLQAMNADRLIRDKVAHIGSGGVSENNQSCGFRAAFRNQESGCVVLARFKNGALAPMHLLDGLPEAWVLERDACSGRVMAVKPSVIAGFLRQGRFYTREQAAAAVDGSD